MAVRPRVAAALAPQGDDERFLNDALNADPQDDPQDDADPQDAPRDPDPQPLRAQRRQPDASLSPAALERIAAAERTANEAVARADALMQQFQQRGESPEQEAARLATMTPEQQTEYRVNKALANHSRQLSATIFNTQNTADQATFGAMVAANPQLKRFASDVEKKHADLVREAQRTNGQVPTRQTVLTYLLGERALELAQQAKPQQEARRRRVNGQQVRAPDTRSDVGRGGRRPTTAEDRLANVQI